MTEFYDDPFDGKTRAECWYADIIHLPHHQSKHHPHLTMRQRAVQFAPFSALSGFQEALSECARTTVLFRQLNADELEQLNLIVSQLLLRVQAGMICPIIITHFVPDAQKDGGAYVKTKGNFKGVNMNRHSILLEGSLDEIQMLYVTEIKEVEPNE